MKIILNVIYFIWVVLKGCLGVQSLRYSFYWTKGGNNLRFSSQGVMLLMLGCGVDRCVWFRNPEWRKVYFISGLVK